MNTVLSSFTKPQGAIRIAYVGVQQNEYCVLRLDTERQVKGRPQLYESSQHFTVFA